jgi:phosphinothricin acetyltransferase
MHLIDCDSSYSEAILAIINEVIVSSTALYDYRPRDADAMAAWFAAKRLGRYPVIGALADAGDGPAATAGQGGLAVFPGAGELMGFATYGPFRPFPAYKYTVEHSLYVAGPFRGRGVGKFLLAELIERARRQDYHVMVAGIDSANAASIALHRQFGFVCTGTLPRVGFKFGRWLDLCFYQLTLDTPRRPRDG